MVHTSIVNYLQAVTLAHKLRGILPPCVSAIPVKLTLACIKRVGKKSTRVRDPITIDVLLKFYNCLNLNVKSHVLFWAMSLLLFRTLLRVGHVVKSPHILRLGDIIWGKRGFVVRVKTSKTSNVSRDIPVAALHDRRLCAFFWLNRWCTFRSGITSPYLFCDPKGNPISYHTFASSLSNVVVRAGVSAKLSTHSFRHGGASFLASLGVPFSKIKERGGWKSNAVFCYLSEPLDSKIRSDFLVAEKLNFQLGL